MASNDNEGPFMQRVYDGGINVAVERFLCPPRR